jgi:hypothetical protein
MGHACDHPPRPRQLEPGRTGGWQRLLRLAPPPDHQLPGDAPFHHPAARQHLHATRARWRCLARSSPAPADSRSPVLNALPRPTPWCGHPRSTCPSVGAIGPPMRQAGPLAWPRRPPPRGAVAGRTIGRRHEPPDEQAWRLHQDMARAPLDWLPPSLAPEAIHARGLDRWAIKQRRAGLGSTPCRPTESPGEHGVQALPTPGPVPAAARVRPRLPRRQVMRPQAPGTAPASPRKHRVQHVPEGLAPRSSHTCRRRHTRLTSLPLGVRQVSGIELSVHRPYNGSTPRSDDQCSDSF